ncbi:MAG: alpha/beta fold hydrolase [Burkholderiales bacterium]|nr:alpha/beta fold hydrolase [Burkholderiales bacterium]
MTSAITSSFKTSDGCNISYTLHNSAGANAPRVALVHSLALDRSIWDGVVQALAKDAQVLVWDCRGHGQSGQPLMTYTPQLFARDLAELMDHVQWPSAIIGGCSMGGMVAQAFVIDHPKRATGLVLIDTTAWYGADAPKVWRERGATGKEKGMAALVEFQTTRWFGDAFRANQKATVDQLVKVFLANNPDCYVKTCEMLGDGDLRAQLATIRVPTAVVVGEEDYATPVAMAEALHKGIAGSTLTVIPGGRHITPTEKPQDIAARIREVIAKAG